LHFRSEYLQQKDGRLFYQSNFNFDKPALIFLHGFPFSGKMWSLILNEFPIDQYNIVVPDLRGHGNSEHHNIGFSIDTIVEDIIELMDFLSIKQATFIGLSLGGYILFRIIDKHEHRITSIVLSNTKAETDNNANKEGRFNAINLLRKSKKEEYIESSLISLFSEEALKNSISQVSLIKGLMRDNSEYNMILGLLMMASRPSFEEVLAKINCPVLVIASEMDKITPPNIMQDFYSKIPASNKSSFHLIKDSGHLSCLEQPENYRTILLDFLRS